MKKKVSLLIMLFVMAIGFVYKVNALEREYTDYELIQGGGVDNILKNEKLMANRKKSSNIELQSVIPNVYNQLNNYPVHQQEKSYWCGPAVAQGVIEFSRGYTLSQSSLAERMNTNSDSGTYVYILSQTLTDIAGAAHEYGYEYISTSASDSKIYNIVRDSINSYVPVVLHARTRTLYKYNGKNLGHYLTAIGYYASDIESPNGTIYDYYLYYADNFYADYGRGSVLGIWKDSLENVAATVKGRYIIY